MNADLDWVCHRQPSKNSSQRIKLFTGHVIKENMCARKRKQANIFRENTIL